MLAGTTPAMASLMTAPRRVVPGTTYLITRRCAQRQFLLRPSPVTNGVFRYVLAVAARRFGVHLHAVCVLSNHFHLVVTDVDACLPAFEQYLDSLVARALNAALGRWESFWAPSSYSAVALVSPEDVLDKMAYTLANPVAAGLVQCGRDWPGLWSPPELLDAGAVEVARPSGFFRSNGPMPETVQLELTAPPGCGSPAEFRDKLVAALAQLEGAHAAARASERRGVLGVANVLAQEYSCSPAAPEPRRQLRPAVAARDKWKRIEALSRLTEFLHAYRQAREAMRRGVRDVVFPAGTYWLRVGHGVQCAAPG
jgi:putative transposase